MVSMSVCEAIREADAVLPGEPVMEGPDARWQAIIRIGEYVESDPEPVWEFIRRWGSYPEEDLQDAIATCLLEHLLECHFTAYFPRVEQAVWTDPTFGKTFQRCWRFGQAEQLGNAERFTALVEQLQKRDLGEQQGILESDGI
jgi:hypothetical protein